MPESEAQQINVVNQVVAVTVGKAQCDKARPDVGSLGHVTGHGIDLWPCVVNLALMALQNRTRTVFYYFESTLSFVTIGLIQSRLMNDKSCADPDFYSANID